MGWNMIDYFFTKIHIKDDNGEEKEALAFRDNFGYILEKEEALKIIEKLKLFYEREDDIDSFIEKENTKQRLYNMDFPFNEEKGLFSLKNPITDKRKVKDNIKRHWGFTCGWCGNKWSSKDNDYYYIGKFRGMGENPIHGNEMACSEDCSKHISLDLQKTWINDNGYKKYFDI